MRTSFAFPKTKSFPFSIGPLTGCLGSTENASASSSGRRTTQSESLPPSRRSCARKARRPSLFLTRFVSRRSSVASLLKPLNVSLKEAVNFYIAHHKAAAQSCTVEAAVTEYLKNQELKRRSERHIADLNYRLGVFKEKFGTRSIGTLSVHEVEAWLHGLGQAPKSLNNFHTAVSALFSFSVKRAYTPANPFDAIDKVRVPAKAPGILSPEQCEKLLNAADSKILPLLAIQAFCGVRSAETLRLSWSDIDTNRGHVQVAAEHAKGARRRLVDIPDNLKEWLRPYANLSGKLWPRSQMEFYRDLDAARVSAGITEWPSNALRHSFASYHLAYHQNAAALALQMGHTSQTMIFSNYREVVTREDAEALLVDQTES